MRFVGVALVLASSACTTQIGSHPGDAQQPRPDAAPFTPPGSVAIRVQNDGTRMLYVQASGWSGQAVTAIIKADGTAIGGDSCELCNCETCPSCAVCGRSIARVAELAPGTFLDFPWDQTDWSVITHGCRADLDCEQPVLIPSGPLTARAAYSDTFETTTMFGPEESFIGPAVTAQTVFQHPATDVVVVSIQ